MQPDDPLVVDDFEEFEFVEDFSLAILRALGRKVPDFSDEFPIGFPIRHFPDDASRAPGRTAEREKNDCRRSEEGMYI